MKRKALVVVLLLLACVATVPFSARATTVSMTFTGVNGQIDHGYYIDPYYATVGGVANTPIWCVDFNHEVYWNDTWTANVTTFPLSDVSNTYLKDVVKYEEMIWLVTQYSSQDPANKAAMQWVIWDLSLGNQSHSSYYPTLYANWLGQAQTNYGSGNYTGWAILTDITGVNGGKQEFIARVPEPSTLLLLGLGLIGCAVIVRRRVRIG